VTAPLADEELRAWASVEWMDTCSANLRDVNAMARELLAARGEFTRWRSIGVDMVHGAMLAVAGVSLDENQAERIKLREERDALRESLRVKEAEVADLLQQRAQGNGWDSDEWYGELCRVEAVLNAVGGMEISRPCSDLVGAVICQRDAASTMYASALARAMAAEAELSPLLPLVAALTAWAGDPRGADDCIHGRRLLATWQGFVLDAAEKKAANP